MDKLMIEHFYTEKKLIHFCNGLYGWQIKSISLENGVYTLFYWIGNK